VEKRWRVKGNNRNFMDKIIIRPPQGCENLLMQGATCIKGWRVFGKYLSSIYVFAIGAIIKY